MANTRKDGISVKDRYADGIRTRQRPRKRSKRSKGDEGQVAETHGAENVEVVQTEQQASPVSGEDSRDKVAKMYARRIVARMLAERVGEERARELFAARGIEWPKTPGLRK